MAACQGDAYIPGMKPSPSLVAAALERPGVRVRTLVTLRWIAIGGQCATLVYVGLYLRFPLEWHSLIAAVAAADEVSETTWKRGKK